MKTLIGTRFNKINNRERRLKSVYGIIEYPLYRLKKGFERIFGFFQDWFTYEVIDSDVVFELGINYYPKKNKIILENKIYDDVSLLVERETNDK